MKKITAILLALALAVSLAACGDTSSSGTTTTAAQTASAVSGDNVTASEATGDFSMTSEDGSFTNSGSVYTVSSAGTYSLSGLLEGQIVVEAGEEDEVVLELSGATIRYGSDSPVKIVSAGSVDISAKSGTENVIDDTRGVKTADDDTRGDGAVFSKCDLKLKGSGTLVVNAAYNNGVHTTKDLSIQKLVLKVTAYNNALKGNDSVSVDSGTVVAVSTNGDGVKTENTDVNNNGATRGDIVISGGSVAVYAAGDGIQAAHDFELCSGGEAEAPSLSIYTGSYSEYTASDAATTSYKGVKVRNELRVSNGSASIQSYDDGLHADAGTALDDGTTGLGAITVSGGTVTLGVYSPETKTAGGQMGPGGMGGFGDWGGQQTVSGADGIHADGTLNITGGVLNIDSAFEGLEANVVNISGGTTSVAANDDGVNACKGSATPLVNVTGGYLEVAVSTSGDTDGIDSNGSYTQSGGVVITKGPNNQNMAALDTEASAAISGGTLIILGYGSVSATGSVKSYSLSIHSAGTHTVDIGGTSYTITNSETYGNTTCYSDVSVSA